MFNIKPIQRNGLPTIIKKQKNTLSAGLKGKCITGTVCCSDVADLSINPFVDFLKEVYTFVNCNMHLIWLNIMFTEPFITDIPVEPKMLPGAK